MLKSPRFLNFSFIDYLLLESELNLTEFDVNFTNSRLYSGYADTLG